MISDYVKYYLGACKQRKILSYLDHATLILLSISIVDSLYLSLGYSIVMTLLSIILIVVKLTSGRFVRYSIDGLILKIKREIDSDPESIRMLGSSDIK